MKKLLLILLLINCGLTTPDYIRPKFIKPHTGDVFRVGDVVTIRYSNGSIPNLAVQIEQGKMDIRLCYGEHWVATWPGVWNFTLMDWKFLCGGYHTSGVYDRMNIFVE